MEKNVFIVDHPLVQHNLSLLRDKNADRQTVRRLIKLMTTLVAYEATKDFPLINFDVETPVTTAHTKRLFGETPSITVIMRAGDGMKEALLEMIPEAKTGFIVMARKEGQGPVEVEQYKNDLPDDVEKGIAFLLDVMVASGTSASKAIKSLKDAGATKIKLICLIACEAGINKITLDHPDVEIFCAAVDKELDSQNYISPGMGDAGDRQFGKKREEK